MVDADSNKKTKLSLIGEEDKENINGLVSKEVSAEDKENEMDSLLKAKIVSLKDKIIELAKSEDESAMLQTITDLKTEIAAASKSMTSIPKPLKFVLPFFIELKEFFYNYPDKNKISLLADILSCIGMIVESATEAPCLDYKLQSADLDISRWGHEYVKHLGREFVKMNSLGKLDLTSDKKLQMLLDKIVNFDFEHGGDIDAIDLLLDLDRLDIIFNKLEIAAKPRTCSYLMACQQFIPRETDMSSKIFELVFALYVHQNKYADALCTALASRRKDLIKKCFSEVAVLRDVALQRQLSIMVGSCGSYHTSLPIIDEDALAYLGNEKNSEWFEWLSKELNVYEPKKLEDIYKSNIIDRGAFKKSNKSVVPVKGKENLAATLANALVHVGFGRDSLVTPEDSDWVFKNPDECMSSAVASLGLIYRWNLTEGFEAVDRYTTSSEEHAKAGALLAFGLIGSGIVSDLDASSVLISDHLGPKEQNLFKIFGVLGYGITKNMSHGDSEEIPEEFLSIINDSTDQNNTDLFAYTCLSLGLMYTGSRDEIVVGILLQAMLDIQNSDSPNKERRCFFASMGLAFLYAETDEAEEGIFTALDILESPYKETAKALVNAFSHAGSGNVIRFHETLKLIGNEKEKVLDKNLKGNNKNEKAMDKTTKSDDNKKNDKNEENEKNGKNGENKEEGMKESKDEQKTKEETKPDAKKGKKEKVLDNISSQINVVALAMIALGEKIEKSMCYKIYDDLLRYEDITIRRAVPLGIALLFISKPEYCVIELLSKLSHENDEKLAANAIFALGVISAGTNNSKVGKVLRNLAVYNENDADLLFAVRISQGLLYCGKGTMTLNPYHFDGSVLNVRALIGLFITLSSFNDIIKKESFLLYFLALAIRPRMLITVDEQMKPLSVDVRVGHLMPNSRVGDDTSMIVGFQTHTTPVLLSNNEKAMMASKKYLPLSPYLEGIVVLRPNPEYVEDPNEIAESK